MNEDVKTSVLDLLLQPEIPDVRKQLPEKCVRVERLSQLAGNDVVFRLKGVSLAKIRELQKKEEFALHIVLEGCAEPDFRDNRLLRPDKGIVTPLDVIASKLLPGEIDELSMEIQKLCGYINRTLTDVKNG